MENKEISLKQAIEFLEMNAYEGSNAKVVLRMGDVSEVLKPIKKLVAKTTEQPAKEKFEELGYKQSTFYQMLMYKNIETDRTILFMENNEKKHKFRGVNISSADKGFALSIELLNAINEQFKELGWL